jgi:Leucine-rich repeat (LRR) protein
MMNPINRTTSNVSTLSSFWENLQTPQAPSTANKTISALTPAHLEKSLTEWMKNATPTENRLLAKQKILETNETQLTTLDLNGLALENLPECLGTLTHLTTLKVAHNALKTLPNSLALLKNLKHLDLYDNRLQQLPTDFEQLENLETLDLRYNQFSKQPKALNALKQLQPLDLVGNPLEASTEHATERTLSGPACIDTPTSPGPSPFSIRKPDTLANMMKFEDLNLLGLGSPTEPPIGNTNSLFSPMTIEQAVTSSQRYLNQTSPSVIRLKGSVFQIQQKNTNLLQKLHLKKRTWVDLKQKLTSLHGNRAEAPYLAHNELFALIQSLPRKHQQRAQIINHEENQQTLTQLIHETTVKLG